MTLEDLIKGMPELEFGGEAENSPVLRWLMMTEAKKIRMDTAQVVFDLLRGKRLIVCVEGKWKPTPAKDRFVEEDGAVGIGALVEALQRIGGKGKWKVIVAELAVVAREHGRRGVLGHWPVVRLFNHAIEAGAIEQIMKNGYRTGYQLTKGGAQVAGEAEAELIADALCSPIHYLPEFDGIDPRDPKWDVPIPALLDPLLETLPTTEAKAIDARTWFARLRADGRLGARLKHPAQLGMTALEAAGEGIQTVGEYKGTWESVQAMRFWRQEKRTNELAEVP